jgi:sulfofructose kinase
LTLPKRIARVDCLGLGIVPLDLLFTVPHFPIPGHKIDAVDLTIQGGGPIPNCLVGMARLGLCTSFVGAVGDDFAGRLSLDELKREKVETRNVVIKKRSSALAAGMIEVGSGRRTISLFRSIQVKPLDLNLKQLPISRVVHLDGRDMAACMKLARWARRAGALISLDIGSIRNDVSALIPLVDQLVVADTFALAYCRTRSAKKAIEILAHECPGEIVVTEGIKGSLGYDRQQWYRQPTYKVKVVDTTGAGDSFHAGYLFGLLKGKPMPERLKLGAAVAALKCMKPGARTGAPTIDQLNLFLKRRHATYA